MLTIGCHLSNAKGYLNMAKEAVSINANTFQFFTRNPRGGKAKDIDPKDIEAFCDYASSNGIQTILAHAPYTLNPASDKQHTRDFAQAVLSDDLLRMENTPYQLYNMHPGSHVGQGGAKGIKLIIETLNAVLKKKQTTTLLLETMSGKGSEIGATFEEIRQIIDGVKLDEHVGVCLDTCHIWDGGYDIVNSLDKVVKEFDNVIGLNRLKAIHINDSKNVLASHKDRHAAIGEGCIGLDALCALINHPSLQNLPFFLETPHDSLDGYAKEISILRGAYGKKK